MMLITLGYKHTKWQSLGIKKPIVWDTDKVPAALVAGTTGSGKSVLCQLIVKQLLQAQKDIYIADFKAGGDWDNILPSDRYGEYKDCDRILDKYYDLFCDAIQAKAKADKYLIVDEFSSFVLSKDKKEFQMTMDKVSHLAFMQRSFGFHLVLISQQFNSKVIDTAIREQFGIKIHMGRSISVESATMMFPNCEIDKSNRLPCQCGYIATPETSLDVIQAPYIRKPERLKQLLVQLGQAY